MTPTSLPLGKHDGRSHGKQWSDNGILWVKWWRGSSDLKRRFRSCRSEVHSGMMNIVSDKSMSSLRCMSTILLVVVMVTKRRQNAARTIAKSEIMEADRLVFLPVAKA